MCRILVVDDEHAIVDLLKLFLDSEGYEVLIAYDGQEGLDTLETKPPDLVLCDVMMPVLGGREMGQKMQSVERYRSIPFVLMSAVYPVPPLGGCKPAALITKPFDLDLLQQTISRLLPLPL